MGKRCVVPRCNNYESSSITFRRIPKNPAKRARWVDILKIDENDVGENSFVCNAHFSPEKAKRVRLLPDDLPHIEISEIGVEEAGSSSTVDDVPGCSNQVEPLTRRPLRERGASYGIISGIERAVEEKNLAGHQVPGSSSSNAGYTDHLYASSRSIAFISPKDIAGARETASSTSNNTAAEEMCKSPDLFDVSAGGDNDDPLQQDDEMEISESKESASQPSKKSNGDDPSYIYESPPNDELLDKFYHNQDEDLPRQRVLEANDDRNYIVNERQLRLLMRYCPNCGGKCSSHVVATSHGVDANFAICCEHCRLVDWRTQPTMEDVNINKGNLDMIGAIILAGGTFEDVRPIAHHMKLEIMSESTYYKYANEYIYPLIEQTFYVHERGLLDGISYRQSNDPTSAASLSMDCRFSRPGYTASFAVTSATCLESGKIISHLVKEKTDDDVTSSSNMETEATKTILRALMEPSYAAVDDVSEEAVSDEAVSDEMVSEEAVSDEAVSDEAVSDEAVSEEAVSDGADIDGADIDGADIDGADIDGADIDGADIDGADIDGADSDNDEGDPPGDDPIPIRVDLLVTDENAAVMAMVRKEFPGLQHQADPWHMCKSIMKRITAASKKACCCSLGPWLPSIRNWIWTAMKECGGDGELLVELWRSLLYHITGRHEWAEDATFVIRKQCLHSELYADAFGFLPATSKAYCELAKIVNDKKIHNRLRRCTSFAQTSLTESFHSLLLKYTPKRLKFTAAGFVVRTKMAVMDWNENVGRPIKKTKTGAAQIRFAFPAAAAGWRARRQFADRTTSWSDGIMMTLDKFARKRWLDGHTVSRSRHAVSAYRPLGTLHDEPDKVYLAAQLFR